MGREAVPAPYLVQQLDRLIQGHGLGWAAFLALGYEDQEGDVAAYLVAGLGVPDGPFQDLVGTRFCPVLIIVISSSKDQASASGR
ncbi:MAG: hypothetical protein ACR2MP_02845 [Streptosporangiaceae bacterium]